MTLASPAKPPSALLGGISSSFRINPYTGAALQVVGAQGPYVTTADGRTFIDMFMKVRPSEMPTPLCVESSPTPPPICHQGSSEEPTMTIAPIATTQRPLVAVA